MRLASACSWAVPSTQAANSKIKRMIPIFPLSHSHTTIALRQSTDAKEKS